jgi:hypothetical protein
MPDRFARVDRSVPLALLPVRLQARFKDQVLKLRVLPDQIHANAHSKELTALEYSAGQAYWNRLWKTKGGDAGETTLARTWIGERIGSHRSVYVAEQSRPSNWGSFEAEPKFPDLPLIDTTPPIAAELLPDFWVCRLYDRSLAPILATRAPNNVAAGLRMAPSLASVNTVPVSDDHVLDFLKRQNLDWMVSFEAAVEAGMALEIQLPDNIFRVGAVIVAGVRAGRDPIEEVDAFDRQLANHWHSFGFDILTQGTPTNNTDAGRSSYTETAPDMDALFAQNDVRRPAAAAARAAILKADASMLLRLPAADAASVALGMTFDDILDRCPDAEAPEGLGGWVMNACVGQGLANYATNTVFTQWGGGAPLFGAFNTIADHHTRWVRGAGPLPSIRVGPQPYGILPIDGGLNRARKDDEDATLLSTLRQLYPEWKASLPLPTLDPEATDGDPSPDPNQMVATLTDVLGAVPHPANLHLRLMVNNIAEDAETLADILQDLDDAARRDPVPIQSFLPDFVFFFELWEPYRARIDGVPTDVSPNPVAPNIEDQIAAVNELIAEIETHAQGHIAEPMMEIIEERLLPLLAVYQEATEAIPAIIEPYSESGGLSVAPPAVRKPDDLLNFVGSTYAGLIPVDETVTSNGSLQPLVDLLNEASAGLETPSPVADRARLLSGPAPLLHHLIERTYLLVPEGDAPKVRLAFQLLVARLESDAADPAGEADRLMRESLGLFMHRLDAWITSFASKTLGEMRQATPRGIGLGGYGWLLDLAPSQEPVSDGFIHAASMTHAATAALLRSGWKGYGTSEGSAPLSVDLSSARVRGAEWVLDGVRNGQDIADSLGARFERSLHDDPLQLDSWIDEVRGIVNTAGGRANPKQGIVDGLLLARAYSTDLTTAEQALRDDLDALTIPVGAPAAQQRKRRVRQLFMQIADDLDAVADVLMLESVHALAQGNSAITAASLNFGGDAQGTVPEIIAPQTPKEAQLITHRVVAVWGKTAPAAASGVILSAAEPRLAAWLAGFLPSPSQTRASVSVRRDGGAPRRLGYVTLASLGLDAAEAMVLAGRGVTQQTSALGRLVLAVARAQFAAVDPKALVVGFGDAGKSWISIDRFGLLAAAAQEALTGARALTPADVVPSDGTLTATPDADELAARIGEVATRLKAASTALQSGDSNALRIAAYHLAAVRLQGSLALAEQPGDQALLAAVQAALTARIALQDQTEPGPEERLARMVGSGLPVMPVFQADGLAALQKSAKNSRRANDVEAGGDRWWRQVRRVNRSCGQLADFLDLAECLAPRSAPALGVTQLPDHDEGWAAITRPSADARDRLCLFAVSGHDRMSQDDRIAGLVLDSWVEGIPQDDRQTGLAFHFDAPSARAPQTILLSLLESGEEKSVEDQVFAQLLSTIDLMKLRALGPDRHRTLGHYLPATFLPGDTELSEARQ